jgi:ABC-type polysaccharide transport system, permease component
MSVKKYLARYWQLYLLLILPIAYFVVFKYAPMYGVIIAFKNYNIFQGIMKSPWVGLKIFKEVFSTDLFYTSLRNTILLNMGDLILSFPAPILLALLLNEFTNTKVARVTQTIIYVPHFLSWVIVGGMVYQVFASQGIINMIISALGAQPVSFLSNKVWWVFVYIIVGIWHSAGYGTIIYLAALTSIDPELYDAAYVDGANRWRRMWYITLPGIKSTIVILLILQLGKIMNISFERPFLLQNSLVNDVSKVISIYVYEMGLQAGRFDFATAVGLFQSLVGLIMLVTVNQIAKKLGEEGVM